MVYLLAPHSSALQTHTMKFRQDFIGPLFIDTTLDKMHYRLEDATGLLLLLQVQLLVHFIFVHSMNIYSIFTDLKI